MTEERWRKVADIYGAAQDQSPSGRLPFVREASAGDSDLRRQVESLLAEDEQSQVLDTPLLIAAGEILDNPSVQPGTLVGPYRIDSLLGVGGMGEVYRARDTKLNRDVAIKILPPAFANDPDRLARFKREAQVLASLNHPNIAAIYGFEDSGAVHALVLELVEGETLADLLAGLPKGSPLPKRIPPNASVGDHRRPKRLSPKAGAAVGDGLQAVPRGLPVDEALAIARQIADALEAAHEQGIIHRDLKPANIKVRDDGTVKVLDFGLAKLADPTGTSFHGGPSVTQSPTITTPAMTAAGMILGTAAYMSPEQAKGRPADKRSDIWAFGCVLYEMLTGKRAFDGEDVSDTLASILRSEPDWKALQTDLPDTIKRLLKRCLQKDWKGRLHDVGDARLEIVDVLSGASAPSPPRPSPDRARERIVWLAGAAIALAAGIGIGFAAVSGRSSSAAAEMRLDISTPPSASSTSLALSPDGRLIVYVAAEKSTPRLWLRRLSETGARSLPGTEGAQFPFWSPDSRSIGFFAANKLMRIDIEGGPPRALANVFTPGGGTWNASGTILYVPNTAGGVFTISANGGETKQNADALPQLRAQRFPHFLPDGRHFLVHAGIGQTSGVYAGVLGLPDLKLIVDSDTSGVYTSGRLLFVRGHTLFSQPFDPGSITVSGSASKVADDVGVGLGASMSLSVSTSGLIAYRGGSSTAPPGTRRLVWFDRRGAELNVVSFAPGWVPSNPVLSHDGRNLAVQAASPTEGVDIFALDLEHDRESRLTADPAIDAFPVWAPDGTRVVFSSTRTRGAVGDRSDFFIKSLTTNTEEPLYSSDELKALCDWSPDGRFILYRALDSALGTYDLMGLPLDGNRKPFPVARSPYDERDGQFAPNGQWIAYEANELGRSEIYVQAFPQAAGPKLRVSAAGGTQARWRPDGKELFYLSPENQLMAAPVEWFPDRAPLVGKPVPLFQTPLPVVGGALRQQYVVSHDGQKFLINAPADEAVSTPITVLLNWHP